MKLKGIVSKTNGFKFSKKLFSTKINFEEPFKWGTTLDEDLDEFRKEASRTIDYIADLHTNIEKYPISTKNVPGFLDGKLDLSLPRKPKAFKDVLQEIDENIVKNYTLYNHPGFMADTNHNSYPAILGNFISDAFNNPGVSWVSNPAGFELERIVLEYLTEQFNLPSNFKNWEKAGCCVHLEAGESANVSVLAARFKKSREFPNSPLSSFCYYYSSQANPGAKKSVHIGGGHHRIVNVKHLNNNYEMDVDHLKILVEKDIKQGLIPCYVNCSVGNLSTVGVDDVQSISSFCNENKLWCHIDASILGNTLLLEENKYLIKGMDKAQSLVIEGQRGLPVGLDSAFFWVEEVQYVFKALNEDFVIYVQFFQNNQAEMTNYHFGTARATKSIRLWMVLKSYGLDGLKQLLRKQIKYGKQINDKLCGKHDSLFESFCSTNFSTICFTGKGFSNDQNKKFVDMVNDSGKLFISSGEVDSKFFIKIMINDLYITDQRVDEIVSILNSEYFKVLALKEDKI